MKRNSLFIIFILSISGALGQQTASINASIKTAKVLEKKGDIDGALSIYKGVLERTHNILFQFIE